jgi:hypothetical protein
MPFDLSNPDNVPFGRMPREAQLALFAAWLDGGVIQRADNGGWWPVDGPPEWWAVTAYRVRPAPVTPDVIPWAALAPKWKWAARDKNGSVWVYDQTPILESVVWRTDEFEKIDRLLAIRIGTCDWRDSLQQRPEGV